MISWQAFSIAVRTSLENPPVSKLARAAASFTIASALMKFGNTLSGWPVILKLSSARAV